MILFNDIIKSWNQNFIIDKYKPYCKQKSLIKAIILYFDYNLEKIPNANNKYSCCIHS